ncbi:hypothetical protein ACOMHN_044579 [Nucella lapillus]
MERTVVVFLPQISVLIPRNILTICDVQQEKIHGAFSEELKTTTSHLDRTQNPSHVKSPQLWPRSTNA